MLHKSVTPQNLIRGREYSPGHKCTRAWGLPALAGRAQSWALSAPRAQDPVHTAYVLWPLSPKLVGLGSGWVEEDAWGFPPVSASCHCCCAQPGPRVWLQFTAQPFNTDTPQAGPGPLGTDTTKCLICYPKRLRMFGSSLCKWECFASC